MAPQFTDCLKKREEFSISLRKKKKAEILETKRKRMLHDKDQNWSLGHQSFKINHISKGDDDQLDFINLIDQFLKRINLNFPNQIVGLQT